MTFAEYPGIGSRPSAERLMRSFAARTGICAEGDAMRRYLWTDAFAVFALLGLYHRTGNSEYLDWTLRVVDLVHHVLGRHRLDDPRSGWISGLDESSGERRPTCGGLRIGKPLPERDSDEDFSERLEWDRDGQYFHYLTKWMHALNRVTLITGDHRYNDWAIDLAIAAHRAFVYAHGGRVPERMYWKMSTDLSRPLVYSMGQLDPLDGLVAFSRIRATQREPDVRTIGLDHAIGDMHHICEKTSSWATSDALGIGGLLTEAGAAVQLIVSGHRDLDTLLNRLLADLELSLLAYAANGGYSEPCESRLAFRELGLTIGLQSLSPMLAAIEQHPDRFGGQRAAGALGARIKSLVRFAPLAEQLEQSWLAPAAQRSATWTSHLDINSVMLATSLVPEVYLLLNGLERSDDPAATEVRRSKEPSA